MPSAPSPERTGGPSAGDRRRRPEAEGPGKIEDPGRSGPCRPGNAVAEVLPSPPGAAGRYMVLVFSPRGRTRARHPEVEFLEDPVRQRPAALPRPIPAPTHTYALGHAADRAGLDDFRPRGGSSTRRGSASLSAWRRGIPWPFAQRAGLPRPSSVRGFSRQQCSPCRILVMLA